MSNISNSCLLIRSDEAEEGAKNTTKTKTPPKSSTDIAGEHSKRLHNSSITPPWKKNATKKEEG